MFVTMNRFTINPEHRDDFENRFRQRAGLIDGEPGFIRNSVLRPQAGSSDQHCQSASNFDPLSASKIAPPNGEPNQARCLNLQLSFPVSTMSQ